MELIIRTENESNFNWIKKIIGEDHTYQYKTIPQPRHLQWQYINVEQDFHHLPKKIKELLKFDKTDFIISILENNLEIPIISLEITASAPPSQHIEQRTARMISAAETGVIPIFICPSYIKTDAHEYSFDTKFYNLFNKIGTLNKIPFLLFHFPDNNGTLLHDEESHGCPLINHKNTQNLIKFIKKVLLETKSRKELDFNYFNNSEIKKTFNDQLALSKGKSYKIDRMDTCQIIKTKNLIEYIKKYSTEINDELFDNIIKNMPSRLMQREKSLIFFPGNVRKLALSRLFAHAGDPYAGMIAALDYAFCRLGPTTEERDTNLIFIPK